MHIYMYKFLFDEAWGKPKQNTRNVSTITFSQPKHLKNILLVTFGWNINEKDQEVKIELRHYQSITLIHSRDIWRRL